MTAQTLTLTSFLLARIAADERHARKLAETDTRPVLSLALTVNHPQRILLECEAKRRIVGLHDTSYSWMDAATSPARDVCSLCNTDGGTYPCTTLRALALPYADHPDYDPDWRP